MLHTVNYATYIGELCYMYTRGHVLHAVNYTTYIGELCYMYTRGHVLHTVKLYPVSAATLTSVVFEP